MRGIKIERALMGQEDVTWMGERREEEMVTEKENQRVFLFSGMRRLYYSERVLFHERKGLEEKRLR